MDTYIARQPIFNKAKAIHGYELLFRDGLVNFFPEIDPDIATSRLLSSSFYTVGLDKLTGGKKAFVNFTKNLLVKEIPMLFPTETTVVEILEDIVPDERVMNACLNLSAMGYRIALDDFGFRSEMLPLIRIADIIKIDFQSVHTEVIKEYLKLVPPGKVMLLAEKVKNHEEFNTARDLGFDYFQGYFFCWPEIISGKEISGSKLNLLQIMAEANKEDIQFDEIDTLVSRDVSISYKLLRYINSAYFKRLREISSIKQALVYLGEREIRRFISLIAMSKLASGKPNELIRMSCIRAKFCELAGSLILPIQDQCELFTLGLFSLIDAILDQSMYAIMQELPLTQRIMDALVNRRGDLIDYLSLSEYYEKGNWDGVARMTRSLGLDEKRLPALYLQAVEWGNSLVNLS